MDELSPRLSVHCCACSRLILLPEDGGPGSELTCVFCSARQVVREMTVLTSEALEQ